MGRTVAIALFLNILCFAVTAFGVDRQVSQAELERIEQIRQMIEQENYAWQAGVTSVSHLSPEEFRQLLGLRVPADFEAEHVPLRMLTSQLSGELTAAEADIQGQGRITPKHLVPVGHLDFATDIEGIAVDAMAGALGHGRLQLALMLRSRG